MKIAILFGSLNRGGAETLLLDVFETVTNNTLPIIGIYRKSGILESRFIATGNEMVKLPMKKNIFSYLLSLRKQLLQHNVTVAHAQQPIDALLAKIATLGTSIKVVLTLHGYDFTATRMQSFILKVILPHTNKNIYVSQHQLDYYQKKYNLTSQKQCLVYNGILFDKLKIKSAENINNNTLRMELGITQDVLLLGSVGNFTTVRDQLTLCKAALELDKLHVDFRLVFAGKAPEGNTARYDECVAYCIENKLTNKVLFLGSREDIPSLLVSLDAFVYATDHDTFGIAVVEAIASAVPCFVNDWEVMTEITENGKYATIYPTKDALTLSNLLANFSANKVHLQNQSLELARNVRERYSIDNHINNLKSIYISFNLKN